jgi:RNA polymerase sigma factor (sigma-70 family)
MTMLVGGCAGRFAAAHLASQPTSLPAKLGCAAMGGDLATLVSAAADGDRDAWDAIVTQYSGLVWTVARSFRLSAADAADVSQATWLRLVEHLNEVRDPDALGAWLATTTRREALALLRKRREVPMSGAETPDPPDDGDAPWQRLLSDERDGELWRAFHRLPQRCQALLRLLVIEPTDSYAAAAAALDVPVGSLGPTRARCLATLREHLRTYTGEEGVGQ